MVLSCVEILTKCCFLMQRLIGGHTQNHIRPTPRMQVNPKLRRAKVGVLKELT